MSTFLPLLLSVLLTFLWLWVFLRRDLHPEPPRLLGRTFAWGMVAWCIAAALGAALGPLLQSPGLLFFLALALFTAVVEEGSKFLAATTVVTEPEFDEPMDGLVYAVTAALGFALMENVTYSLGFGGQAATYHALFTTLAHALFSAPQGYALGGLHWQRPRRWVAQGLLLSVILHFVFNGILTGSSGWPALVALGVVVLLMLTLAGRYYLSFEAHARGPGRSPAREAEGPVSG